MKEFYIGQKVVVSDTVGCYTTYRDMAKLMHLSNWEHGRRCPINEPLTIIAKEKNEHDGWYVYGLEDSNGQSYMSGALCFSLAKPTRTEYVKVTEPIFDLKEEFERGRLFHNECVIRSATALAECYAKDEIYRRIEKEFDWRERVIEDLKSIGGVRKSNHFEGQLKIEGIFDKDQALMLAKSIISSLE